MKPGDTVLINGKPYTLGKQLGHGVQGNVFDMVENEKFVIKVINTNTMSKDDINLARRRLEWLNDTIAKTDLRHRLTLPKSLLDNQLGYVMLKANEHDNLYKYIQINSEDSKTWLKENYSLKKRYQIITLLFQALRDIHINGLVFTDLSPNNIMYHKSKNQIVFIDTDNLRKRTEKYLSVLGTPGYMAPEIYHNVDKSIIQKGKISESVFSKSGIISPDSDIYSAAIIAFQLLTLQHPFIGDFVEDGEPKLEEEAFKGETDYVFKEGTKNISTSFLCPYFDIITTAGIRRLFERTFIDGKTNPRLRPTDIEFMDEFQKALDLVVTCPTCGFDNLEFYEKDYSCSMCNEIIKKHITLKIYTEFDENSRSNLINLIVGQNLLNHESSVAGANRFEISRVVIEPNVEKNLYNSHLDGSIIRNEICFRIKCKDENTLDLWVISKKFKKGLLIDEKTNSVSPLNEGKNFPNEGYRIYFDRIDSSICSFKIIGKLE